MRPIRILAPLLIALGVAPPAAATDNDLRSVAAMQHHDRVVLVFSPTLKDPRLAQQRGEMARFAAGAAARDLLFVQVAEGKVLGARDDAGKLHRKYAVAPDTYLTLLIGKDGNVALRDGGPVPAAKLQQVIDAMPMRQDEVRRAKAGLGKPGS